MHNRTTRKKIEADEKRVAEKVTKARGSTKVATPVGKAAKLKAEKSGKLKVCAKLEPVDVDKAHIMKAMPSAANSTQHVAPVTYNGGVVYTILKQKKFRALRVKGDRYTETSATWGTHRSQKDAWSHVIKAIDKHQLGKSARAEYKEIGRAHV